MTITQFFHGWKGGELSNLFGQKERKFILENKRKQLSWKKLFSNFFVRKHLHVFT